jgi:hypothetical protein
MKTYITTRSLAVAIVALSVMLTLRVASAASVSSTVNEDNRATTNGTDQNQNLYDFSVSLPANHPAIVTAGSGYNFGTSWQSLTSINQITLSLSMFDGNSGSNTSDPANFDFNHLHFYLGGTLNAQTGLYTGGIDTGIILNGFAPNAFVNSQTFTLAINPNTTGASILSALQSGSGVIAGYVVTDNANDTALAPNEVALTNDLNNATTTLTLASVPEPGVCTLIGTGLLMALAPQVRRFRRNI